MSDNVWFKFYEDNPPPPDIQDTKNKIASFCNYHSLRGNSIILVTSGGTTVPLEHNTVRFVDNFSAGTRGSASAEYFLTAGYPVIFMHRSKSREPFVRHFSIPELLECFEPCQSSEGEWKIEVQGACASKLLPVLKSFKKVTSENQLLKIEFTTLSQYLHILYIAAQELKPMKNKAILYLAAAVSDFYIPQQEMSTHKISSDGAINLNLQLVPKVLQPLVRHWVPEAFVVSFKLETDEAILITRAKGALEKYGHKLVIANELNSIREKVIFVTKDDEKTVSLSKEQLGKGIEIEECIVKELLSYYSTFKSS